MSAEKRSLLEKLAAWASRLRADLSVGHLWVRTAIRDEGTAATALPLTEVHHDGGHTPDVIARSLEAAIADVVDVDEKGRSVRLYPLNEAGEALRQGLSVRLEPGSLRSALVRDVAAAAQLPEETRAGLMRDVAYGSIIAAQRTHAETLHTHLAATLESTHALVSSVVGSLGATQAFAQSAIQAQDARSRAAEARTAELETRLASMTSERDRAMVVVDELDKLLAEERSKGDRYQRIAETMAPFLAAAGARFGRWVAQGHRPNGHVNGHTNGHAEDGGA